MAHVNGRFVCDGTDRDVNPCYGAPATIHVKGYAYCATHAEPRRSVERKLRPHEQNRLARGERVKY